jgi:putative ubiquitin-RnfH superfamily antitoxin RatB of RatAB toxin-antitoxin module
MEKPESANAESSTIPVEVAYALPERQRLIKLQVPLGCTALEAVRLSQIAREFPGLDIDSADMGIFAKNLDGKLLPTPEQYVLKPRDRVEIYRPLQADPKAARAQRAARVKEAKEKEKAGGAEQP